jgi:hypothetical protein
VQNAARCENPTTKPKRQHAQLPQLLGNWTMTQQRTTKRKAQSQEVEPHATPPHANAVGTVNPATKTPPQPQSNFTGGASQSSTTDKNAPNGPTIQQRFYRNTGRPEQADVPAVIANVQSPPERNTDDNGCHISKTWFEACQCNGRMDNDDIMMTDITNYVWNTLFPGLKFIMADAQMEYSNDKHSLCYLICQKQWD